MPARDELLRLADACENASGPSYTLDCEIWDAIYPSERDARFAKLNEGPYEGRLGPADRDGYVCPLRPFTASVDAALTLVPEGHVWSLFAGGWAGVAPYEDDETIADAALCGATPALALCAAALRARAASPPQVPASRGSVG